MADEPQPELDIEALQRQIASFDVRDFIVSASSTLASLAYAKLDQQDLPQAKRAIDALVVLVPLVEGELKGDLEQAVANLQVAYSTAVTA